jgi:hypothetical protein
MSILNKVFYTVVIIPLILYVLPVAFGFFDVDSRVYFIYMMWFIGLIILNAILPDRVPNIFAGES